VREKSIIPVTNQDAFISR